MARLRSRCETHSSRQWDTAHRASERFAVDEPRGGGLLDANKSHGGIAPMPRSKPPFRADVVGSLLRTAPLKEARAKREKGEISAAQLKEVEDREIEKIIKKQENVGLKVATDGEFRRSWWHFDFFGMLDGVEITKVDHGIQFHGVQTKHRTPRITGKLGFSSHPMLDHFKFLKAHTRVTPKMTIPSPAILDRKSTR